jgi:hypothetical protein
MGKFKTLQQLQALMRESLGELFKKINIQPLPVFLVLFLSFCVWLNEKVKNLDIHFKDKVTQFPCTEC